MLFGFEFLIKYEIPTFCYQKKHIFLIYTIFSVSQWVIIVQKLIKMFYSRLNLFEKINN